MAEHIGASEIALDEIEEIVAVLDEKRLIQPLLRIKRGILLADLPRKVFRFAWHAMAVSSTGSPPATYAPISIRSRFSSYVDHSWRKRAAAAAKRDIELRIAASRVARLMNAR